MQNLKVLSGFLTNTTGKFQAEEEGLNIFA